MTATEKLDVIECKSSARAYLAVTEATHVYDNLGGLRNDARARAAACSRLQKYMAVSDLDAAELIAGALARRAHLRSTRP